MKIHSQRKIKIKYNSKCSQSCQKILIFDDERQSRIHPLGTSMLFQALNLRDPRDLRLRINLIEKISLLEFFIARIKLLFSLDD